MATFECCVCLGTKESVEAYGRVGCVHDTCSECMNQHMDVQEAQQRQARCPLCLTNIPRVYDCGTVLWGDACPSEEDAARLLRAITDLESAYLDKPDAHTGTLDSLLKLRFRKQVVGFVHDVVASFEEDLLNQIRLTFADFPEVYVHEFADLMRKTLELGGFVVLDAPTDMASALDGPSHATVVVSKVPANRRGDDGKVWVGGERIECVVNVF